MRVCMAGAFCFDESEKLAGTGAGAPSFSTSVAAAAIAVEAAWQARLAERIEAATADARAEMGCLLIAAEKRAAVPPPSSHSFTNTPLTNTRRSTAPVRRLGRSTVTHLHSTTRKPAPSAAADNPGGSKK